MNQKQKEVLQNKAIEEFVKIGLSYPTGLLAKEGAKKDHRKIIKDFDDAFDLIQESNFTSEECTSMFTIAIDRMKQGFLSLFVKYAD